MYSKMYDSCARGEATMGQPRHLHRKPAGSTALKRLTISLRKCASYTFCASRGIGGTASFREYAEPKQPHTSRWNFKGKWVNSELGVARVRESSPVRRDLSHSLQWRKDRFSLLAALRIHAGSGLAPRPGLSHAHWYRRVYRNYPNVKKGADRKCRIHDVNNHEPIKGAQDTMEELSAMRGILPVVIRASEILGVDARSRPFWREFVENLAPLPTNEMPDTLDPRQPGDPLRSTASLKPYLAGNPRQLSHDILVPACDYDLCTCETEDRGNGQDGERHV